ncbi:MAG: hypothetical protein HAW66_05835 [Shewanella sp.]|nr:hypothetical protein [Shewanella sp.]
MGGDLPSWYLIAPISGEIPWFRLPTDIESKMANGEFYQFDISLTGYNFDGDYDDLRKEMATYSRKQGYKWENYYETLINEKIYTTVN